MVAGIYNQIEEEKKRSVVLEYQQKLSGNDRLYDYEKRQLLERKCQLGRLYQRDDISESDIEHVICSAIPIDRHGNLTPGKASKLNDQFAGKGSADIIFGKFCFIRLKLTGLT